MLAGQEAPSHVHSLQQPAHVRLPRKELEGGPKGTDSTSGRGREGAAPGRIPSAFCHQTEEPQAGFCPSILDSLDPAPGRRELFLPHPPPRATPWACVFLHCKGCPSPMLSTVTHPACSSSRTGQRGYLGHLLLPLGFGRLGVSIVVSLDDDQIAALGVDHKLAGRVL